MPIEQHPIPQDVAGYKFRLIGDMTLKQFIWLAGGIILGLFIYQLPLPFFFKYPLAAIAVGLGAGIAFVPIEGRQMDKWLIAFIKSIYSPTQYVWQKGEAEAASPIVQVAPKTTFPPTHEPAITPTPEVKPVSQPIPIVVPKPVEITPPTPKPVVPSTPVAPRSEADLEVSRNPAYSRGTGSTPAGQLPIPFTPTNPNTLVGMTLTPDSKILPGCLIEIKSGGLSQRATKSNQLGQFLFAKPLENGVYQIATEKAGYQFDTYSLNLTG
ncbi:MAG: PrgI family protein, partial [Patescibacteria group bacterium]